MKHVTVNAVDPVDPRAIQAAVRQAMSEELAAARADELARASPPEQDVERTAAIEATIESGHRYIAEAVTMRRWGNEQAAHIRELRVGMTAEQHRALVQPLVIAVNSGQVEVDVDGPLF